MFARTIVKVRAPALALFRTLVVPFVPIRRVIATLQISVGEADFREQTLRSFGMNRLAVMARTQQRDFFAAHSLQLVGALFSSIPPDEREPPDQDMPSAVAKLAFEIADAMIRERGSQIL